MTKDMVRVELDHDQLPGLNDSKGVGRQETDGGYRREL